MLTVQNWSHLLSIYRRYRFYSLKSVSSQVIRLQDNVERDPSPSCSFTHGRADPPSLNFTCECTLSVRWVVSTGEEKSLFESSHEGVWTAVKPAGTPNRTCIRAHLLAYAKPALWGLVSSVCMRINTWSHNVTKLSLIFAQDEMESEVFLLSVTGHNHTPALHFQTVQDMQPGET